MPDHIRPSGWPGSKMILYLTKGTIWEPRALVFCTSSCLRPTRLPSTALRMGLLYKGGCFLGISCIQTVTVDALDAFPELWELSLVLNPLQHLCDLVLRGMVFGLNNRSYSWVRPSFAPGDQTALLISWTGGGQRKMKS